MAQGTAPVIVGSQDRGARGMRADARPLAPEAATLYAVSRVRLDDRQRVSEVVWGQIDAPANRWATEERRAPVADVVDALHEGDAVFALFPAADGHVPQRRFVVVLHADGTEAIALDGPDGVQPGLAAMDRIVD